ncbi:MAG: metallophosphoesterase [Pirellulaceae bacterium]
MTGPGGNRTIAIGDIHGCWHALEALLAEIVPVAGDEIVVLGDFIDNGPQTREVIDALIDLQDICRVVYIKGNHEEMLLDGLNSSATREYWEMCGGFATINSYRYSGSIDDIPPRHIELLQAARDWYETPSHLFTHANFDAHLPMRDQPVHTLRWSILEPENVECHHSGKTAIVGHTEQSNGEILDLECVQCIDTSCWRYGWLTALDVHSGQIRQASRFGMLRQRDEAPVGPLGPRE